MKRRDFISTTINGAVGISLGATGLSKDSFQKGANDKIVLALIGTGGRGTDVLRNTLANCSNVEVKTVCDVNSLKGSACATLIEKQFGYKPQYVKNMKEVYDDKDVDAVIVATPEHWHALASVWAMQAGKDVYVEKNISLSIWEGRKMVEAAKKYNRIVQCGTQCRSGGWVTSARDYIKSGKLGNIVHVQGYCTLGQKGEITERPVIPVPKEFDWNAWLGPRPYRPLTEGPLGMSYWYQYWDFSGGIMADDASHNLDLIRMVLGDPGNPISVYGWGRNILGSKRETPEIYGVTYDYGNFTLTMDGGAATNYMTKVPENIREDPTLFPNWPLNGTRTEIYGTEGLMYLARHGGGWQVVTNDSKVVAEEGGKGRPDVPHEKNFIDCVRSRKQPNGNIEQGHLGATLVHLANIAHRVGNKQLLYDGENERFIGNDDANNLLKTSYRDNYKMPENV
jgi:predicted dehydrogenase